VKSPRIYDEPVREHYDHVAEVNGLSPASTMADEIVRDKETRVILEFVEQVSQNLWYDALYNGTEAERPQEQHGAHVIDVGCGNGYTLNRLATHLTPFSYTGVEFNAKLLSLASQQVNGLSNARVISGDLRDRASIALADATADVVVCQRVLINLLESRDQRLALNNIISLVRPGGYLLFIEAFQQGLANLNDARCQFGLLPIEAAVHNCYLAEGFFNHDQLSTVSGPGVPPANLLSTHYYVSRVLHDVLQKSLAITGVERNSHFVRWDRKLFSDSDTLL
jgi:SAM-dependent methyltransferase